MLDIPILCVRRKRDTGFRDIILKIKTRSLPMLRIPVLWYLIKKEFSSPVLGKGLYTEVRPDETDTPVCGYEPSIAVTWLAALAFLLYV